MDVETREAITIDRQALSLELHNIRMSAMQRYKQKAAGDLDWPGFIRYELANLCLVNMGGGLGYRLRNLFYGPIFRQLDAGVIIGRGVVVRHPRRISLGAQVAIDDNVLLDASGAGVEGLRLGKRAIVSRNCIVQGKTGPVAIGENTDIGVNTIITSVSGIFLEPSVLVAGNCYIGGSRYYAGRRDMPIMNQGWYSHGPIHIGEGSWIGAGVIVLDGVTIGKGCIVGAGAVVTRSLPDYSVSTGVPAKVIRYRGGSGDPEPPHEGL